MKRTSEGSPVDAAHPALCFHREVLTNIQWSAIRRDFLAALEATPELRFNEPSKLWRHSQEALGKWVLSQVARDTRPTDKVDTCHFFPTTAMVSTFPDGVTYDAQLIRDLSLKCDAPSNPAVVSGIRRLLKEFDLSRRCQEAARFVERALCLTAPSLYCTPRVRIIAADELVGRTASQRRMEGAIAQFDIIWSKEIPRSARRGCPSVCIPLAAYRKLEMCYKHFAEHTDGTTYSRIDAITRFTLRAAALALRYEGCLATGSLQLCADTRLKQHLHAAGYHVIDLCASPINAYMASPREGSYMETVTGGGNSSLEVEKMPNHFCSAFLDTDRYFGSAGSALSFDVGAAYRSDELNKGGRPLLLTLDVPYDEDLCERLFTKLIADMKQMESASISTKEVPFIADYVLVLPLWWDVPMHRQKRLFTEETVPEEEEAERIDGFVKERSQMLLEGHQISYEWPKRLAEAAGERWVVFDGVFVGGSYEYFCTSTNKWLRGVTATEVIGLSQPMRHTKSAENGGNGKSVSLEELLSQFYGRN